MLNTRPQADFAHGDAPGLIDICIMPQLYNADRWGVDVSAHTNIARIAENCAAHPAFQVAHPDAVKQSESSAHLGRCAMRHRGRIRF